MKEFLTKEDFYLIDDLDEFNSLQFGHIVGIGTESTEIFYPSQLFKYVGYGSRYDYEPQVPTLFMQEHYDYDPAETSLSEEDYLRASDGWTSRWFLDQARTRDFYHNKIKIFIRNKQNSTRFIID